MNETNNLEKEMAALTETTSISIKDDLITMSFRKGELEAFIKKNCALRDKFLESLQPKKDPEIYIPSRKDGLEAYLMFHNIFQACTNKKVDAEGFINGIAFAFSLVPASKNSEKGENTNA